MVNKKDEYVDIEEHGLILANVDDVHGAFGDVPEQLKELKRLGRSKKTAFREAKSLGKALLEDIEHLNRCFLKGEKKAAVAKKPVAKKKAPVKKKPAPKKKPTLKSLRANLKQAKKKMKK